MKRQVVAGILSVALTAFLNFPNICNAQIPRLKYLGIESGLSNNSVTCMTQDQYGFIWIGTYDGLDRYDGSEFKAFSNDLNDPRSLCNNHIKALVAVRERIYVGTEKGLTYLDNGDLKFHPLYLQAKGKPPI